MRELGGGFWGLGFNSYFYFGRGGARAEKEMDCYQSDHPDSFFFFFFSLSTVLFYETIARQFNLPFLI